MHGAAGGKRPVEDLPGRVLRSVGFFCFFWRTGIGVIDSGEMQERVLSEVFAAIAGRIKLTHI